MTTHIPSTVLALIAGMLAGPVLGAMLYADGAGGASHRPVDLALAVVGVIGVALVPPKVADLGERDDGVRSWGAHTCSVFAVISALRLLVYSADATTVLGAFDRGTEVARLQGYMAVSNVVAFAVAAALCAWPVPAIAERWVLEALGGSFVLIVAALDAAQADAWSMYLILSIRGVGYGVSIMAASAFFSKTPRSAAEQTAFQMYSNLAILASPMLVGVVWSAAPSSLAVALVHAPLLFPLLCLRVAESGRLLV